ncbi:MAG: LCP family protein [Lachnospiraceae bacterium]|nr:LCP family protein [Lachnospiraceae bacterium]
MVTLLWFVTRATDADEGIQKVEIPTEDIIINDGVGEDAEGDIKADDGEKLPEYRTIALFGLDSTIGELAKNTRSDTIMIAAIDNETKEVHLMSVYRDTYLNLGNDTYSKCNSAYAKGGAKQAINMLNMNLDLAITDFVAVGFKGVMDAVNAVGGVYIDIDEGELQHINNYQISIAENLKIDYKPVAKAGYQKVDGLQATAYCRIRYVGNYDFQRTERQREVLQAMLEEAKGMEVDKLTKLASDVFGDVYTSVDLEEIITLLSDIASYTIVDEGGFPSEEYRANASLAGVGSSVVCTDLEAAVADMHSKLYQKENYQVSEALKSISSVIHKNTDAYVK